MNAQRWEELQLAFNELTEMDESGRADRLARLAIGDPELHRAVASLLQADAEADARLAPIDSALFGTSGRSDPLGLAGRTGAHFRRPNEAAHNLGGCASRAPVSAFAGFWRLTD